MGGRERVTNARKICVKFVSQLNKNVMDITSAIAGMTVSEMRRNMSEMRHKLHTQSEEHPFNLSSFLASGYPIWKFVHEVGKKKRHELRID